VPHAINCGAGAGPSTSLGCRDYGCAAVLSVIILLGLLRLQLRVSGAFWLR